jgi:hypothetical protein
MLTFIVDQPQSTPTAYLKKSPTQNVHDFNGPINISPGTYHANKSDQDFIEPTSKFDTLR